MSLHFIGNESIKPRRPVMIQSGQCLQAGFSTFFATYLGHRGLLC